MFIQKGKIRFSQKEVWDLDTHLAKIIYTGLVQFKQSKRHGTPSPFLTKSTAEHLLGTATEETRQIWEEILDQMIYAFSPQQEYDEIESSTYELKMIEDVERKSSFDDCIPIKVLTIPKADFTQQDIEAYRERKNRWEHLDVQKRQQGRELFVKYFNCLWD
ncbi:hypothetical protein V6347_18785 [Acinetobacter baumannii]|uniref:hypothetical protein n=1 Tax=Acinetobacter baumannii TaxID=470 RepID=UPI002148DCA4|nr:hypothetical protein [Acinetobacter baumannii]MCR0008293.1 hypothetical protein [Acinetobacter baumannii]MCZ3010196.1 hypothetical protein [Acinetobacter baumannii]HAV3580442.1 hypothetical protein [Acinetobacter baumannii]